MAKKQDTSFLRIPNDALGKILLTTMRDAAALQAAGVPLPEFKTPKPEKLKLSAPDIFSMSNAGLGDYVRVSLKIAQKASDLSKGPKLDP